MNKRLIAKRFFEDGFYKKLGIFHFIFGKSRVISMMTWLNIQCSDRWIERRVQELPSHGTKIPRSIF